MEPGQVVQPGGNDDQSGGQEPAQAVPPTTPSQEPPPDVQPTPPSASPLQEPPAVPQPDPAPAPIPQPPAPAPAEPPTQPQIPPAIPGPTSPAEPPADTGQQDTASTEGQAFSWQASEYVEHNRTTMWYVILGGITLAIMAFLILVLREWLSALVIALMAGAIAVYARKSPRTLQYSLQTDGISIGEKFYPYTEFRGFAVVENGSLPTIELDPTKRFMPRISIFFDRADEQTITEILESVLPRDERQADAIDRLSHYLKF